MNEKVLNTIIETAKKIAPKFKFGYYDADDLIQECIIIGIEAYERYDESLAGLETFLYHHMNNRLKNLIRNKYKRKCPHCKHGCPKCEKLNVYNRTRMNLINAIPIDSVENIENERDMSYQDHILENMIAKEIEEKINAALPKDLRADYLRLLNGIYISPIKRAKIEELIKNIL